MARGGGPAVDRLAGKRTLDHTPTNRCSTESLRVPAGRRRIPGDTQANRWTQHKSGAKIFSPGTRIGGSSWGDFFKVLIGSLPPTLDAFDQDRSQVRVRD